MRPPSPDYPEPEDRISRLVALTYDGGTSSISLITDYAFARISISSGLPKLEIDACMLAEETACVLRPTCHLGTLSRFDPNRDKKQL